MPADQDLLFGKIAVELGFCTEQQVESCLAIQEKASDRMSLGRHMVREGCLTEDQHSKVLERQRRNLSRVDPAARAPKGDVLFGRLAVREGLATEEQVNDALREQGRNGDRRSLGEVFIAKGILNAEEVRWILGLQSKWIMRCPRCAVAYTVHSSSRTPTKAVCPRCRSPLAPEESKTESATAGELDTAVRRKPNPRADGQGGGCKICDHPLVSDPGSDGRVECLSCRVRFVP